MKDNFSLQKFIIDLNLAFNKWYNKMIKRYESNEIDLYFINNNCLSSSNVIEKIKYDINKYFSQNFILNKEDLINKILKYNENKN